MLHLYRAGRRALHPWRGGGGAGQPPRAWGEADGHRHAAGARLREYAESYTREQEYTADFDKSSILAAP